MQHRDMITIQKVISEMQIGIDMLGTTDLETFLTNEMLKRALGMTAINVGELVKVVTDELRNKHKKSPWQAVAGMRDITAHLDQTLRMEDVYMTVHEEYPVLMQQLQNILKKETE